MHVRAVGLSEPFEVTLLPNPDYSGEHRIVPAPAPRSEPPPPVLEQPAEPPLPEPEGRRARRYPSRSAPTAASTAPATIGPDEMSGLHDTERQLRISGAGNGQQQAPPPPPAAERLRGR